MTKIIIAAIPLFLLHAWEEYTYQFYLTDPTFDLVSEVFKTSALSIFLTEQVVLTTLLLVALYWQKRTFLILAGLIFVFELTHVYTALRSFSYAVGLITSLPLLVLGVLYWRKLLSFLRQ